MELKVTKLREEFKDPHHLIKTSDGKILFLRAWLPETGKKDTAFLIFHGITAYSKYYEIIGVPLSKEGYSVFGLDLRGHGLSDGIRGDYPSKERLNLDVSETMKFLKEKFSKLILLGHSLGNILALNALLTHLQDIKGLILVSVARTIKPDAYPKMSFGKKLKMLFTMIFSYKKPIITYPRKEYLQQLTNNDPLYNYNYTPRFYAIFNVAKFQKKYNFPNKLDFPVFMTLGEKDELFSVEAARKMFDEIPSKNKEFYPIPNAKHAEYPEGSWDRLVAWVIENFK